MSVCDRLRRGTRWVSEKIDDLFFWAGVGYEWRPRQLWYSFKCWAWRRHSTVKPRTLKHTWVDRGHLLPHMMFEILGQFLEQECGKDGIVDWDAQDSDRAAMAEMRELWRWWNEEYLKFDPYKGLDGLEDPLMFKDEPEELPGFGKVYTSVFSFSSPEAEATWKTAHKERQAAEEAMEAELKSRQKRLVDVQDFMWT